MITGKLAGRRTDGLMPRVTTDRADYRAASIRRYAVSGSLVIQDVLTLHGSQFRNAALIVARRVPGQSKSYRAMRGRRRKALRSPPECAV